MELANWFINVSNLINIFGFIQKSNSMIPMSSGHCLAWHFLNVMLYVMLCAAET